MLVGLSDAAEGDPAIVSADLNPLIVADGVPVAVDALVEVDEVDEVTVTRPTDEQFLALFEPKGVVVAGASSHPGKFGFVALHNLLASGYQGRVFATNLQGEEVLGIASVASIDDLPDGEADLVFVCTPGGGQRRRAARPAPGGASRRRSSPRPATARPARRAAGPRTSWSPWPTSSASCWPGPNGQGVVSTPAHLCAQIVAPYPPAGRIAVASQSGNFVSSFMNYATATGIGIAGPCRPATRRRSPWPTTSTSTPTTRPPRSASPTSRASPTAGASPSASGRWPSASRSCW